MSAILFLAVFFMGEDPSTIGKGYTSPDLVITGARVTYHADLDLVVFEQTVKGRAGETVPREKGQLHGAGVLGYVFPTNLKPSDVGFQSEGGVVALVLTSHPDFDDTPLWDENMDSDYGNDGVVWHTHWVVLEENNQVPGGLAVRQIKREEMAEVLPPTHPGMPMLMDSPGFGIALRGDTLRVLVPANRIRGKTQFQFDAVSAYMQVNTSGDGPMLGVYHVYGVLSGDLSLPYRVTTATR